MPTPKKGYLFNNKKVPSVTTIIGRFKESSGLMSWYHKCGVDGVSPYEEGRRAADAGTAVHDMIQLWLDDKPMPKDILLEYEIDHEQAEWAESAFKAFCDWDKQNKFEILESEISIINEEYLFAGTPDAIASKNGRTILLDWKTSSKIYDDHLVQAAAYAFLYQQEYGEPIDEIRIVRFDKKTSKYEERIVSDWAKYLDVFLQMRKLYGLLDEAGMLYYKK